MRDVRYLNILPAENPVCRSKGLNLLLMVDNRGEAAAAVVRFYGSDGTGWREIYAGKKEFPGQTHVHAYFYLPPACFAPEMWDGEELEELAIWAGEAPPPPGEEGQLLFFIP
ncbi:MAG: hypothetical protein Q4D50_10620 [Eubacteriales bacterium]|nr:hypothetical protein [Eubacteriales bacterium]